MTAGGLRARLADLSRRHARQRAQGASDYAQGTGDALTDAGRVAFAREVVSDMPELEVKLCEWLAGRGIDRGSDND
jgi:hypothetical protein